jgi:hypothetical protein
MHRLLTMRASGDAVFNAGFWFLFSFCFWGRRLQFVCARLRTELIAQRDEALAVSTAVAAVATSPDKTLRQNVQRPAACELDTREFYGDLLFEFRLVFAASHESHDVVLAAYQAAIRDRAAGHVTGQVF